MTHPSPEPRVQSWPVPAFVQFSAAVHLGAAAAAAAHPPAWPLALGAVVLNHAAITAAGLWPRSTLLGPNVRRLPGAASARGEVALTIDDGPDPEVTPRLLDLLDAHRVRATFFCIGERVRAHPALAREILARGHTLANHSQRHVHNFSLLGLRGYERELRAAQQSFVEVTGCLPRWFRAPAGLRNPFLAPVLHRLGLQLVSWSARGYDTRERDPQQVLRRLTHRLAPGAILLLHDGHAARTTAGEPVVLAVLPALLAQLRAADLRPVTLDAAFATACAMPGAAAPQRGPAPCPVPPGAAS